MNSELGELLLLSFRGFFTFLRVALFIRIILSWVAMSINTRGNPILAIVYTITDPILNPIRDLIQKSPLGGRGMMIDFSPIFAFFLLGLAEHVINALIISAMR